MSVEKAKAYYTDRSGPGKLNCGQAVIAAFKEKFSLSDDSVNLFAAYGSGRAPENVCGTLYAAQYLLKGKDQEKLAQCEKIFIAKAGSTKCKEIRKLNKLSCVGCVETIAEFLDNIETKVL